MLSFLRAARLEGPGVALRQIRELEKEQYDIDCTDNVRLQCDLW
jgi:hypothetical protein